MDNQDLPTTNEEKKEIVLSSKKKWFWLAVAIALISPVSGVILAIALLAESGMRKTGLIIFILSFIWGVTSLYLTSWLMNNGYLPVF
jgi:hypothetical protein